MYEGVTVQLHAFLDKNTEICEKLKTNNRRRMEDHADRTSEDRWLKVTWNYKPTGQRVRERPRRCQMMILRMVLVLKCVIHEDKKNICIFKPVIT